MQRVVGIGMCERTLSGAMLVLALGLASCSGDSSGEHGQSPEPAPPAMPVQLEEGTLSVELSSLDLATGQLSYTIENNSSRSVRFLERDTALRGVAANLFDVRLGGAPVAYVGPHFYWDEPRPQDFVELPAGAIVEGLVNLPALYDMSQAGEYTVQARRRSVAIRGVDADMATSVLVQASAPTVVRLADAPLQPAERSEATVPKFRNFAEDCSATDLTNMSAAETTAKRLASKGVIHLQAIPFTGDAGGLYERWFGDPDREPTDVRRVESVLNQTMNTRVGLPEMQFRCREDGIVLAVDDAGNEIGCGPTMDRPVNAATNGSLGTTVHVCPSFLSSSERRKASIMIHEASHHYGTDDFVSDALAAQNLAITDPDSATESGENYEQYVLEFF